MKFYAIAAAWLGGLQFPFVRRSRVAAVLAERAEADEMIANLQRKNYDLEKSIAVVSKSDTAARDEVERLRAKNVQLNADNARRESEITRLRSVIKAIHVVIEAD